VQQNGIGNDHMNQMMAWDWKTDVAEYVPGAGATFVNGCGGCTMLNGCNGTNGCNTNGSCNGACNGACNFKSEATG